jgi:hypothetical protein
MRKISTYQKFTEELKSPMYPYKEDTKDLVRKHLKSLGLERESLVDLYKSEINKLFKLLNHESKDLNSEYQLPLSLLYKTIKFNIEKRGGEYYSELLSNVSRVLDDNGNWSFVNKLNTNYSDLMDFIVDYICQSGKYMEVLEQKTFDDLKKFLEGEKVKFEQDYLSYFDLNDLYNYTKNSQSNTILGDKSEQIVINWLGNIGIKIVYQGSNGDPIDMLMGVDLIGQDSSGFVYTFQVKSSKNQILSAIKYNKYFKINALICPVRDNYEAYIKGNFYTFNQKGFTIPYPGKPLLSILKNPVGI